MFLAEPAVATKALSVTTSEPVNAYLPDVANESSPSTVIAGVPFLGVPTIATANLPASAVTFNWVFDNHSTFAPVDVVWPATTLPSSVWL